MNRTAAPTLSAARATTGAPDGPVTVLGDVVRLLAAHLPVTVVGMVVAVTVAVGVAEWVGHRRHRRACAGAQRVQVLPGPRVDPTGAVVFWQHLLGLLPPRRLHLLWHGGRVGLRRGGHVVFEYAFTADGLAVSVWVPSTVAPGLVAAAARSAWPGSRTTIGPAITQTVASTSTSTSGVGKTSVAVRVAGGVLRLARPAALPIRTDHPADPLRALIGAAGPLHPGQTAVVQVLARPMSGARFAATTRTGRGTAGLATSAAGALAGSLATLVQEIVAVLVHGPGHRTHPAHPAATARARAGDGAGRGAVRLIERAHNRAIAAKAESAGGGYRTVIRYLATTTPTGPSRDAARAAAHASGARAHAVASAFAEFSGHNHYRRRHLRRPLSTISGYRLRRGDALSVTELASLAHLPTDEHVPGLRRAGAAAIAPPPQIPTTGPGVRPLGDSDAITGRAVGLTIPDARHHLWIIGATGAGKSTLCVHGVLADAAAGRAAIVLDPKGDLITDIAARLPASARARTVLIDPDHPGPDGRWPCLNPLNPLRHTGSTSAGGDNAGGDNTVENVVSVFSRVFSSAWGHRSEDLLRVATLTLRAARGPASLADLPALLGDPTARRRAVAHLHPESRLRQFWDWYEQLPDSSRAQVTAPLLNKLRAILLRPFAEQLLCGPSTVDLPRLLDTGGLLLVRLPKGALGEDTVRLIGSLLVAQVWQATLTRAAQPEHQRRDASLLLDECHNFLHMPYRIEDLLAEARGFRLSITLAHQHLAQLTPALRDGIATNARNKIMFAVSPEDATTLARHTLPELGPHDLAHLDGFHAAARLHAGAGEARAFTLTTRPLPPITPPRPPAEPPAPFAPGPHTRAPLRPPPATGPPGRTEPQLPAVRHPDPRNSEPRSTDPRRSGL